MHESSVKTYLVVYAALMLLLAATVAIAYAHLGRWAFPAAVGIASIKALLVILYFMHIRYSPPLSRVFALASFVWLALLIGLTLSDYWTRGWLS